MSELALVTPWPPQQTGIADYAYDLASALILAGTTLVIYTRAANPRPLDGARLVSLREDEDPTERLLQHRHVVYQLGNNTTFHLWMIPLLERCPGTIHLHDMVMHHVAARLTWEQGNVEEYVALMEKWYGIKGLTVARESLQSKKFLWDSEIVTEFPLFEEFLQHGTAVIVHSAFAFNQVGINLPGMPCYLAPQLYDVEPIEVARQQLRRLTVLGGVDPQKHLDWLLDALAAQDFSEGKTGLELNVAGTVDPRCADVIQRAQRLASKQLKVRIHGRLDESQFLSLLQESDLCVALRYPTMGETSAIVMRSLQMGIPTVVNDIGWYSELPTKTVIKLPVADCPSHLASLLQDMRDDDGRYKGWAKQAWQFARSAFDFAGYGLHYRELCDNRGAIDLVTDLQSAILQDCGFTGRSADDAVLEQILTESRI